ncbi:hypothetical protein GCM10025787_32620 [Saccharopolyspora rosea]|uniref:DUF6531 domain-containing protein n=1 Tax=Saccharopolyspora rosea TaxID=524884 RepID=A0ABW3FYZ1_9PSEU
MSEPGAQQPNRPVREILGRHDGYAFAGSGVNTTTGNATYHATDLSFPPALRGLLEWTRTYNSRAEGGGPLGPGWSRAFGARLVAEREGIIRQHTALVEFHDEDGRVLAFHPDGPGRFARPPDLDADLVQDAEGGYALSFRSGVRWLFDVSGRLSAREDEGQRVTVEHDERGRVLRAAHSFGRSLVFSYDDADRLVRVEANDGRAVSYSYGPRGALESVTDATGATTRFDTDDAGRLTRVVDPDGVVLVVNAHDESGRVVRQDFPSGGGVEFHYEPGVTTVTDVVTGMRTEFHADAHGRTARTVDPEGGTAEFAHDERGLRPTATSPGGVVVAQEHDDRGNLVSRTVGGSTTTWDYDESGRVVSETDAEGGRTRYRYEGDSRVPREIVDPVGGSWRYVVHNGLIESVTDPGGATTTRTHDAAGDLVAITDPEGDRTLFDHDAAGNTTAVTGPDGATARWTFDAAGRVTEHVDPLGAVTRFRYSPGGRLLERIEPDGAATRYDHDSAGLPSAVTDPTGNRTTYSRDPHGRLLAITGPDGGVTRYSYDALGRLNGVTDPEGTWVRYTRDADGNVVAEDTPSGTTRIAHDERGNPVAVTDPSGATTRYGYDAAGRRNRITDPEGGSWHIGHDAAGMPVSVTDPTGARATMRWTPQGTLASTTDPDGRSAVLHRDRRGRVTEAVDPEGGITRYAYDPQGRRIAVTTAAGLVTRTEYDAAGHVVATVDPRGWVTRYEYDSRGHRIAETSPGGIRRRYRYDPAGRMTASIDGNGNETQYGYDPAGRLISVTDAKGAVTRFTYDKAGRQTSATDPLGRTTHRSYDDAGHLVEVTDPDGRAQHFDHDENGRLVRRRADDGTEVRYGYDRVGRRTTMTDGTGTTRYSYDGAGRLTEVADPDGSVLRARYDRSGQRTALVYPDGHEVTYRYDLNGRLVGLHDSRAGDVAYAVDPDGRLITEQLPDRLARRYHYEHGLLTRFTTYQDGHPIARTAFTHDPDGRILTQHDDGHRAEFRYDRLGQLVSARRWDIRPWPWDPHEPGPATAEQVHREHGFWRERESDRLHFTYDAVGNRTRLRHGEHETHYRYDAADQLVASEAHGLRTEYRYDSSGRLVERTTGEHRRTTTYDGLGRAVEFTSTEPWPAERVTATVNGDDLPVLLVFTNTDERREQEQATSVRYRWNHDKVPQIITQRVHPDLDDTEHDRPGRLSADFTYGYGRVFASWEHGSRAFHHDAFGSTLRTDDTAAWAQARHYEPFGAPEQHPHHPGGPEIPRFGYRGELALGPVIDLRARWYDASLGRFTTRDPITVSTVGPGRAGHPYAYADNDPLDRVDPLGLLAAPFAGPAARASAMRGMVAGAVGMLAAGRGGDRTSLHNLAVETATVSLEGQMAAKFGMSVPAAESNMRNEVFIKGAGKNGAVNGRVDIAFLHPPTAYLWEVKSSTHQGDETASEALARQEAEDYAVAWSGMRPPPFPQTPHAEPGDAMAAHVPLPGITVDDLQWEVYSFTKGVQWGAVLYGPQLKPPPPRTVPVPQPKPRSEPEHHWYEFWHWHLPPLPSFPMPTPQQSAGAGAVLGAVLLLGVVVVAAA